jgi:hypothetical protein
MEADICTLGNSDLLFSIGRFKFRLDPDGLRRARRRKTG